MSSKFIGRQFSIRLGKEGTRGTKVSATAWIPADTLTVDDKIKVVKNQTSVGVIEDGVGQDVTSKVSQAAIEGRVTDIGFGHILMALMGTDTKTTVGGETTVYDHKFTV